MAHAPALTDHMKAQVDVWPALILTVWPALAPPAPHASKDTMLLDLLAWHAQATVKPAIVLAAFIVFLPILFQAKFAPS